MKAIDKILGIVRALGQSKKDKTAIDSLSADDQVPLDLARATLLVDVALIDSRFDSREYQFIVNTLKADLDITDDKAIELIKTASSMIQFRGSHSFAVELQNRLPLEQRQKIAAALRGLIAADNAEDGFGTYLEAKIRDLLGVEGK